MATSIRQYCARNKITLRDFFYRAWKETKKTSGGAFIIRDVEIYQNYGAIPRYVSEFLEGQPVAFLGFNPYYVKQA